VFVIFNDFAPRDLLSNFRGEAIGRSDMHCGVIDYLHTVPTVFKKARDVGQTVDA
jgi:hypothetical protein